MAVKPAPLNATFMLSAILGFLISVMYIKKLSLSWAIAFAIVFAIMIISSLISMVRAPVSGQLMPNLERDLQKKEPTFAGIEKQLPKAMPTNKKKAVKKKAVKKKSKKKVKPKNKK